MQKQIDKQKLIDMLKSQFQPVLDDGNQARFMYQCGRNSLATFLLMEIAFGELDGDE